MDNFEKSLTHHLYRSMCPDSTELGEYALKMTDRATTRSIQQHLKECPHCQGELRLLNTFMDDLSTDLESGTLERVRVWLAQLVSQAGRMSPAAVPALRGNGEQVLVYEAGEAQVTLEVQQAPADPGTRNLTGLLVGAGPAGWQASLHSAGQQIETAEVDELGSFSLSNIPHGAFTVILSSSEEEIHIEMQE